jgi:SAM-dependent methyltransferase
MKEKILEYLVCPSCGEGLSLENFKKESSEVMDGLLVCSCEQWFPIINFIPRLLLKGYRGNYRNFLKKYALSNLKENAHQRSYTGSPSNQVQKSFGSKWMSQPKWGTRGETKTFMSEWVLDKYEWGNNEGFKKAIGSKKNILDAGTGLGRVVADFCEVNKRGEVFGIDLSEAVEGAYQNTKQYPNAHILQADLMNLPFKRSFFDFIFSEGVLHHNPDTHKAFEVLIKFLALKVKLPSTFIRRKVPSGSFVTII